MRKNRFIFQDLNGSRWRRFKWFAGGGIFLGAVALVLFIRSIAVSPEFEQPNSLQNLKRQITPRANDHRQVTLSQSDRALSRQLRINKPSPGRTGSRPPDNGGIRAAFFMGWDEAAFRSLLANKEILTHLCPEWLSFTDLEAGIQEDIDSNLERIPREESFKLMPTLSNLDGSKRVPEAVEALAQADRGQQQDFVASLVAHLLNVKADGMVIQWEEIDPGLSDELTGFVILIADGLKAEGLDTWLCVTMDSGFAVYDYDRLAPHVDRFVAMLHDENGEGDHAGPLASQDWFDGWMKVISRSAAPEKWIASLGSYGCDWEEGSTCGEQVSFADVMSRAGNSGAVGLQTTAPSYNGTFAYHINGKGHEVWFLDAASFVNQLNAVNDFGFAGVMVNRLGLEDPSIWNILTQAISGKPLHPAALIPGGNAITSIGAGEIVSLDPTTFDGHRINSLDQKGRYTSDYQKLPSFPTLFRSDSANDAFVVLTFDDGPDPRWTPAILDILKSRGLKAVFFVLGSQAERHPEIVKRIIAEGHEIGNHSFTHPNLAEVPSARIQLELNATQRLIESIVGHSTTLFRPPYSADSRPANPGELLPIAVAQSLGYMTILENVDPKDWQEPPVDELLQRLRDQLPFGNIILLHDGGGDRSSTVAALPEILDYIQERGNTPVLLSEFLGLHEKKIMPPLAEDKGSLNVVASGLGFQSLRLLQDMLHIFLIVATILVVLRTVLVLILARTHKNPASIKDCLPPPVTILVPAYNEAKVISKTITSLLASDYRGDIRILVIDDGSTDATSAEVLAFRDPRVRLVVKKNAGKARALQLGVTLAETEFLVFVDADTQFEKQALRLLVSSCQDPKVGAVSGHARVGNLGSFLARCQDLEYICGFNLDRRAYAVWNCITVAPGAISMVRKSAIIAAGGFSHETLAEDTDLTLAIHKSGYRVEYQPAAIAHTEAPETVSALASQRFRWAYGTLQCVCKHRHMIFNPQFKALGWFSLPGIWFFQVILVAFSPLIDLLFLQALVFGRVGDVLPYFLAFLTCDLLLAAVAVSMEGLPLRVALRIVPQRFIYRPLLSFVIWKSIAQALRGAWVGWGKLQRTASVAIP